MNLTLITTADLISILTLVTVIAGFVLSWRALRATAKGVEYAGKNLELAVKATQYASSNLELAAKATQSQVFQQMVIQSQQLKNTFMELHAKDKPEIQQNMLIGSLWGFYSYCFETSQFIGLPQNVQRLLADEVRQAMIDPVVRDRFEKIKHLYTNEFIEYVNKCRGIS